MPSDIRNKNTWKHRNPKNNTEKRQSESSESMPQFIHRTSQIKATTTIAVTIAITTHTHTPPLLYFQRLTGPEECKYPSAKTKFCYLQLEIPSKLSQHSSSPLHTRVKKRLEQHNVRSVRSDITGHRNSASNSRLHHKIIILYSTVLEVRTLCLEGSGIHIITLFFVLFDTTASPAHSTESTKHYIRIKDNTPPCIQAQLIQPVTYMTMYCICDTSTSPRRNIPSYSPT